MAITAKMQRGTGKKQKHNLLFIPTSDAGLVEDFDGVQGRARVSFRCIFQQWELPDTPGTSQRLNHQTV